MGTSNIFQYTSYSHFLEDFFRSKRGKGVIKAAAKFVGVHPSRMTRIIRGTQHPSQDQAFLLAQYLMFSEQEAEYFCLLIDLQRSASPEFKKHLRDRLAKIREGKIQAAEMTLFTGKLSMSQEAILHSNTFYYLIWLASTIPNENTIEIMAKKFETTVVAVHQAIDFLCQIGLCKYEHGQVMPAARVIETSRSSSQIDRFMTNWRVFGIGHLPSSSKKDLFYSDPMAIGQTAYRKIKVLLETTIQESKEIVSSESSEVIACLNIDFFEISGRRN